jgi:sulfate adenylyltransferase
MLRAHAEELGVAMVPFRQMVYVEDLDTYVPDDEVPEGVRVLNISGTDQRRRLNEGRDLPAWFTPPAVAEELRKSYPPRARQGFTVFFTGLPGAGKSTIANVLHSKLLEMGGRRVTLLDGDIVQEHLSSELGFSRAHGDINVRRIGFVASEVTKNGGIALCAPVAPFDGTRKEVRRMVERGGGFILVRVVASGDHESRDRKVAAEIDDKLAGISDPYEEPEDAEVVIDTVDLSPEEAAQQIILHLEQEGYIGPAEERVTP